VKRSPLHERLDAHKAVFRDVSGWECADFFVADEAQRSHKPLSWGKHHWFSNWEAEHNACRNEAALFDMSFMSKFLVQVSLCRVDLFFIRGGSKHHKYIPNT
jgi:glycine cleavage system aminomethyltransferase T